MGPDKNDTCVGIDTRVAFVVAIGKPLQHSVNLLCLFWQLHLHQQLADGHVYGVSKEGETAHVASQHRKKKGIVRLAQVAGDDTLIHVVCFDALQVMAWCFSFFPLRQDERFSADSEGVLVG